MERDNAEKTPKIRYLSRREMLGFTAAAAAALATGCGSGQSTGQSGTTSAGQAEETTSLASGGTNPTPSCVLTPEATEGPYYLDLRRIRKDVTEGQPGVPLQLRTTVVDTSNGCAPLENAAVDIWHASADGYYSGFTANNPDTGQPESSNGAEQTSDSTTFLRGVQLTDSNGVAEFATVYPGWYIGRALHVHLKAHAGGNASGDTYEGGHVSHTGQLFFPEDVSDQVAAVVEPYASRTTERLRQEEDDIFLSQGAADSIVALTPLGSSPADGYLAEIVVGVDPSATPDPSGPGPGGGPPPGGSPPEAKG